MLKDKYKIILIKENHFQLKEYRFSLFKLASVIGLLIFFITINAYFFSNDILNYFEFKEVQTHRNNNLELVNLMSEQNQKITDISKLLDSLKIQEEKFRKLVKLPSIHKDIRKLGVDIDKDKIQSLNDLEYLIPENMNKLSEIAKNINHLHRFINFEILSYYEILDKTEKNLNKVNRYPAIHPVDLSQCRKSSGFGYRRDPFTLKQKMHEGVDYSGKIGTPIYATADGKVIRSWYNGSFGNYIEIDHGYGYKTCYAHLSKRLVRKGEKIERGQKIGEMGNTGKSTAPHLHYEVKLNNIPKNPIKYFFDISSYN